MLVLANSNWDSLTQIHLHLPDQEFEDAALLQSPLVWDLFQALCPQHTLADILASAPAAQSTSITQAVSKWAASAQKPDQEVQNTVKTPKISKKAKGKQREDDSADQQQQAGGGGQEEPAGEDLLRDPTGHAEEGMDREMAQAQEQDILLHLSDITPRELHKMSRVMGQFVASRALRMNKEGASIKDMPGVKAASQLLILEVLKEWIKIKDDEGSCSAEAVSSISLAHMLRSHCH